MSDGKKFEVGEYAYYSWGYGQTNIDWFKVVRRNDKSVWFESVESVKSYSNSHMSGMSVPSEKPKTYNMGLEEVDGEWRNKFEVLKFRKLVKKSSWNDGGELCGHDFGNIYPWDGQPKFFSEWN